MAGRTRGFLWFDVFDVDFALRLDAETFSSMLFPLDFFGGTEIE